jgi:glycosyltransferase involved in cell wall biosynthesis
MNSQPARNAVINNGVSLGIAEEKPRTRQRRLIFTGTMSFPPNYHGAIWFIDNVMPLLVRRDPTIQLVIAGQEPVPELLARSSGNVTVTGGVASVKAEIEQSLLYVAPLISGTGFRNKVVEAINCGIYVIGTSLALDFLDDGLREKLSEAATPAEFADRIFEFLADPTAFDARIAEATRILREKYSWKNRSRELEAVCGALLAARPRSDIALVH